MASKGKSVTQKVTEDTAKQALDKGASVDQALSEAQEATGITRVSPAMRTELGLDEEETRAAFGKIAVSRFADCLDGKFPSYIMAVPDPGQRAKLMLEYEKTYKGTLETALVTKTERRIVENDDTRGRSDDDIKFKLRYGKWPEEMVVNGDEPSAIN